MPVAGSPENPPALLTALDLTEFAMFRRLIDSSLTQATLRFLEKEDGPTAVEYAVMLALIVVVCIGSIQLLGSNANATFNSVATSIGGVSS
jgi:pilus assembly protein Flp/PilA